MEKLNDIMQIDHVIRIREGGVIEHPQNVYAPEFTVGTDGSDMPSILAEHEAQMIADVEAQGWTLETGWTGQYLYSGPIMHASEYIGGALAEHILATPGYWVAMVAETDDEHDEPAGWVLAFREDVA